MDTQGSVAIVTGAGYGIGRGIALRLAAAGVRVVVDDVHDEHGSETVGMIHEAGGTAEYFHADVTVDGELEALIGFAGETFGPIDIFVNNAGCAAGEPYFPQASPEAWGAVLDCYLRAMMRGTQLAIEAMGSRAGAIVNIASSAGVGFRPYSWPEYATAKAGIMRFTAALGGLAKRNGVRVNCICPGWVATETVRGYLDAWTDEQKAASHVPDPMLTPGDIGDAVLHLVVDDALAGRVMLYDEPRKRGLLPVDLDLFALSEALPE